MRTVRIYSTKTNAQKKIELDENVKTLGHLKELFHKHEVEYSGMKIIESGSQSALLSDDSPLPEKDFILMLTPQKTKSGADMSRKELYEEIKYLFESDGGNAKEHFNAGKNYTNKKTSELQLLLDEWDDIIEHVDVQEVEVVRNGSSAIDDQKVIDYIMSKNDYQENSDKYDLAIAIIQDPNDVNCVEPVEEEKIFSDDEISELQRLKNRIS